MQEKWLPKNGDEVLVVARAELAVSLGAIKRFGESPAGIDRRKRLETADRRMIIEPVGKHWIKLQRPFQRQQEDLVESPSPRGANYRRDCFDHVGKLRRPLERLACAHRTARDQLQPVQAQPLPNQHLL